MPLSKVQTPLRWGKGINYQDSMEKVGHPLLFLPPYSPDFNPANHTEYWVLRPTALIILNRLIPMGSI